MMGSDISNDQGAKPASEETGAEPKARPARSRASRPEARPGARPARKPRPAAVSQEAGEAPVEDETQGAHEVPAAAVEGYGFADVVSGEFDAAEERGDTPPAKRVLLPQVDSPKLHKVLAQAGLGSRLEMEQLILEGRISVNNEPAHVGQRIQFGDQIKVNGQPIRFRIEPPPARVIAYHKPVGEVVTHDDPQNRPTVFRKLPRLQHGKWQSVGRLDLNTEGLLLFTSSGELANSLMHPRFGLEREYAARVLGALSKEEKQRLTDGVQLEDGEAAFGSIEDGGGEGANCWYRVTISEGRNREVRRMFEAVGHAVSRLIRIRYGAMVLPRGLKRGAWVELDQADIQALMSAAGVKARAPAAPKGANNGARRGAADRSAPRREGGGRYFDGNRPAPNAMLDGQRPRPAAKGGKPAGQGGQGGRGAGGRGQGGGQQPDPMRTSVGYIGTDSLVRARQNAKRNPGGGRRGGR
ncbi:Ribosomal large subunit pseudouridine synthase B [Delftia tsuruhatensis]|uniref:pseudouridine synthase n=1 Tax=Delftia tsuruhatensis TaxID=180282 RepID=UPI001E796DFF|nr:pseudouridine synthase [Delftia tsuruhatensis]CAB5659823.1 Ribosomal large subunit pseudouridine synthase B [Delftia tsuruhatensis]CAC9679735.1 Ribosomal large subunit pseudouridine synthase B [Delftia tsuruhatensis]